MSRNVDLQDERFLSLRTSACAHEQAVRVPERNIFDDLGLDYGIGSWLRLMVRADEKDVFGPDAYEHVAASRRCSAADLGGEPWCADDGRTFGERDDLAGDDVTDIG
jgi:hypothetical protein